MRTGPRHPSCWMGQRGPRRPGRRDPRCLIPGVARRDRPPPRHPRGPRMGPRHPGRQAARRDRRHLGRRDPHRLILQAARRDRAPPHPPEGPRRDPGPPIRQLLPCPPRLASPRTPKRAPRQMRRRCPRQRHQHPTSPPSPWTPWARRGSPPQAGPRETALGAPRAPRRGPWALCPGGRARARARAERPPPTEAWVQGGELPAAAERSCVLQVWAGRPAWAGRSCARRHPRRHPGAAPGTPRSPGRPPRLRSERSCPPAAEAPEEEATSPPRWVLELLGTPELTPRYCNRRRRRPASRSWGVEPRLRSLDT